MDTTKEKTLSILQLFISIVFAEFIGFSSSLLAGDISGKYAMMNKPALSPPGYVFGPVWFLLYLLMSISAFLIFKTKENKYRHKALILYFIQLALNFLWSIVFFGNNSLWFAFIIIVLLDIAVISSIYYFKKVSNLASFLMIPYLVWILFASYLNLASALLN